MTGSAAKIILGNLKKSRLDGFLLLLRDESSGDLLVALCKYFHKSPTASEEATRAKFNLTPGQYYHYVGIIGTRLTSFLAGNRDSVFLHQTLAVTSDAVSTIQVDAALELIRTGIKLASAVEDFETELSFWGLMKKLPRKLVIEGQSAEATRAKRLEWVQYSDLLALMEGVKEHRSEEGGIAAVRPLLSNPLLGCNNDQLSKRAKFCLLKTKALGHALLREYPQAVVFQEQLVEHVESSPWMFSDPEHELAKEIKSLARLFRLLRDQTRFQEVSSKLFAMEFRSPLAELEKVYLRFPTVLGAAIDNGEAGLALSLVEEFLQLMDLRGNGFPAIFITDNLYWCLNASIATKSIALSQRLLALLRGFGRADFRPSYYLMYRFLEIIHQVHVADHDQAFVLIRNLKGVSGLDTLPGFDKAIGLVAKLLSAQSMKSSSLSASSLLRNDSVRQLVDSVKGAGIVDYFDIPRWIESLAVGRTLMELVHQSATSAN